jgi:hypothetical protein
MLSACMSIPALSICAMRMGPMIWLPAAPPLRSSGVPLTMSCTGTTQCAWMSITLTRRPPIDNCRRPPAGAWARRRDAVVSPPPKATAPAAAPAMVLKKSLRLGIVASVKSQIA